MPPLFPNSLLLETPSIWSSTLKTVFAAQMSCRDLFPVKGEHERIGWALDFGKTPVGVDRVKKTSAVTHLLQRFRMAAPSLSHRWAGEGKDVGRGATVCYFAISPLFFHLLTHLPLSDCCKWAKQKLHEVLDVNISVKPQRRPRSWVLTADSALAAAVPVCTCAVFRCWFGQIVMFDFCNSHHFLNRLVCFQ